eukprot:6046645-Pleurochrysis_carterae.AAC.2
MPLPNLVTFRKKRSQQQLQEERSSCFQYLVRACKTLARTSRETADRIACSRCLIDALDI